MKKPRGKDNEQNKAEQTEVGKIKLSDNQKLVDSLVDSEKLDLWVFVKTDSYMGANTGATKRSFRFCFFDDSWDKRLRAVGEIDEIY